MAGIKYQALQLVEIQRRCLVGKAGENIYKKPVIFLTTPKCGSKFIEAFYLANFVPEIKQVEVQRLINKRMLNQDLSFKTIINYPQFGDYNKFQIVRNPYARIISMMISTRRSGNSQTGWKPSITKAEILEITKKWFISTEGTHFPSAGDLDHIYPQYNWLYSRFFDYLNLENINKKLLNIFPKAKIPDLNDNKFSHHVNSPQKISYDWREYYTGYDGKVLQDLIYGIYKTDFNKFGYEYEIR